MKRIGVAASKMAQGDICKYNFFVVAMSFLFSFIIFFVCEFCVLAVLLALSLIMRGMMHKHDLDAWVHIMKISSIGIGALVVLLNICAIAINIRLNKDKI